MLLETLQIGRHNQLQEWLGDWDDPKDNHRHISHLYALYPSNQISPDATPALAVKPRPEQIDQLHSGKNGCYAKQDKFWVEGAPNGERWEVYTVLSDSETFSASQPEGTTCCGAEVNSSARPSAATCC